MGDEKRAQAICALRDAVFDGEFDEVRRIVAEGLDLNELMDNHPDLDEGGLILEFALVDAILQRKPWRHDMLSLLVSLGADLNCLSADRSLNLRAVIWAGDIDFLARFLELGVNLNAPTALIEDLPILEWVGTFVFQVSFWGLYGGFGTAPETLCDWEPWYDDMPAAAERQRLRRQHVWRMLCEHIGVTCEEPRPHGLAEYMKVMQDIFSTEDDEDREPWSRA